MGPLAPAEPTWVRPGAPPGACEGLGGTVGDPEGASERPRRNASAHTLTAPPDVPRPPQHMEMWGLWVGFSGLCRLVFICHEAFPDSERWEG